MTLLCICFPCLSQAVPDQRHKVLTQTGREHFETALQKKATQKHGIQWRVQDILHRHCDSTDQLQRLLTFAEKILRGAETNSPIYKTDDSNVLSVILNALPAEEEARADSRDIIKILEKAGINMAMLDLSKDTPVLRAIKTENRHVLDALLHTQCDINATDRYSSTCLIYAVQKNDKETVQTILKQFPKTVNLDKADYANYTALAYAASNNNIGLCQLLLQAGARTDVNSTSPLYLAISNNASHSLINLLISSGASVNVSNSDGLTALAIAVKNKQPEIVSRLLESGANYSLAWYKNQAFLIALNMDNLEILKIFVHQGVDISCVSPKGFTIIHEACCQGSDQFLLFATTSTHLNLDVKNRQRRTAAHLAAQYGHALCLKVLFNAGADCWSLDPRGQTSLEIALFHNRQDCVSFFLEHPVFPRQKMFSVLHVLHNDYDPEALSKKPAVAHFSSRLQAMWGEVNQMDTLFNTCVIGIRRFLFQKPASRISVLPLPEKIKDKILSYQ